MSRRTAPTARLREPRKTRVGAALHALLDTTVVAEGVPGDPIAFARRYAEPGDQEVAATIASGLAFGRVAAFWPVIDAILARADDRGGPTAFVEGFNLEDAQALSGLQYRWMRGPDLALWCATLGAARRQAGRLGAIFERALGPDDPHIGPTLDRAINQLRSLSLVEAGRLGQPVETWSQLPRGFRYFLPRPSDGSACKRWCMLLRWMARPAGTPDRGDGVDLGLWDLPASHLVVPLDTHIARLSWFLGLTNRRDGSWRTALEITENLRRLDPDDPVRFDFALAHMGISGRCTVKGPGDRRPPAAVCATCCLAPACKVAGRVRTGASRER